MMDRALRIEVLHSPGCGGVDAAEWRVNKVVGELAPEADVVVRNVVRTPDALARFAGSPTILVDGTDLEPWVPPRLGGG